MDNWELIEECIAVMEATSRADARPYATAFLVKHAYLEELREAGGVVANPQTRGGTDVLWYTRLVRTEKGHHLLTKLIINKVTRMIAFKELSDLMEADNAKETNENV